MGLPDHTARMHTIPPIPIHGATTMHFSTPQTLSTDDFGAHDFLLAGIENRKIYFHSTPGVSMVTGGIPRAWPTVCLCSLTIVVTLVTDTHT